MAANPDQGVNVGEGERWLSAAAGLALVGLLLRRRRLRGAALSVAAWLFERAVTGHCPINRLLGRNSARPREPMRPAASPAS